MKALVLTFALMLSLTVSLTACAHPNYQENSNSNPQESGEKTNSRCFLQFSSQALCAAYDWETYPSESETGAFVARFTNPATGSLIDPALPLKVVLWMPSMGHGSSPVEVTRLSVGLYRVARVYFSMPGTWQIRFQLLQQGTMVEEQIATIQY